MVRNPLLPIPRDADGFQIARPDCLKCFRPLSHCLCSLIKQFDAHCNIIILQHPNERRKYYSTAKIVTRSIKNSRLLQGVEFEEKFLEEILSQTNPYLLFPGPDSRDCESFALNKSDTIIALDGTWSEAGKLLSRNPILKKLPKISFSRELRSEYKIRKQPKEKYLSTLESVGHLLKLNAACSTGLPQNCIQNYQQLFTVFNTMVDRQLTYFPRNCPQTN